MAKRRFNKYAHRQYLASRRRGQADAEAEAEADAESHADAEADADAHADAEADAADRASDASDWSRGWVPPVIYLAVVSLVAPLIRFGKVTVADIWLI